jgi:hypothetical protein
MSRIVAVVYERPATQRGGVPDTRERPAFFVSHRLPCALDVASAQKDLRQSRRNSELFASILEAFPHIACPSLRECEPKRARAGVGWVRASRAPGRAQRCAEGSTYDTESERCTRMRQNARSLRGTRPRNVPERSMSDASQNEQNEPNFRNSLAAFGHVEACAKGSRTNERGAFTPATKRTPCRPNLAAL